jgi:hypothetical protein
MSLIKEKINNNNITRYYSINQIKTVDAAVMWISNIRNIDSISTNYIYLSDLNNRFDEESKSIQLDANVDLSDLKKSIEESSVDIVLLNGKYNEYPIVIGVDLHERLVYITVRKNNLADINALETELSLV